MFRHTAILILPALSQAADTCKALVLSGGGANGAWEAGIFWGLNNYGNSGDFDYQVISGVSAGAINTAALAGWDPIDGVNAAEYLSQTWSNLTNSDIWVEWPLGLAEGLVKPGLLNNAPAVDFLTQQIAGFPEGYKRRVVMSAVNVETGEYTSFNQDNTQFIDLPRAAMSSGSIPFVFPPQVWSKGTFMDGGTVWNVNIDSAVKQCLQLVDDESKITIDVVVCGSPPTPTSKWAPGNDAIADYMYARDIHSFYSNADNLAEEKSAYPNINWRYLFQQSENQLSGLAELTFDNANTWPLQENGRQVAMTTIQAGEGTVFKYLEEYHASQDLKKKHGHWLNYLNSKLRA